MITRPTRLETELLINSKIRELLLQQSTRARLALYIGQGIQRSENVISEQNSALCCEQDHGVASDAFAPAYVA